MKELEQQRENYTAEVSIFIIGIGAGLLNLYGIFHILIGEYFHFITIGVCGFATSQINGPLMYKFMRKHFRRLSDLGWGWYFKSPIIRYGIWAFFISLPLFIFIFNRVKLYFV